MEECDQNLDLGILCSCCDFQSYKLPDQIEGLTPRQLKLIEELCKMCVDQSKKRIAK